jgi:tetratricopeptide (TPR) repeat protein
MRVRKLLLGAMVAAALGVGGWLTWRWYTTPVPPQVSLDGASKAVAGAVEEAREEVRRQPRSAQAWGKLGMVLTANGYPEPGAECFEQAERLDPHDPRWPYLRGLQYLSGSASRGEARPQEGIPLLRRALASARGTEECVVIRFRLALALIEDGQLDEAGRHLDALDDIESARARSRFGRGLLAIARDDRAAARAHLSTLTDHTCARKKACALLAGLVEGDESLARDYRSREAGLPQDEPWPDPFDADLWAHLMDRKGRLAQVKALQEQGRHAEALAMLRKFAAEAPDAEICTTLGYTLCRAGELEEGTEMLRAAISFDPQNVRAHHFLGTGLLLRGEKKSREAGGREAAREFFRQAVAAEDRVLAVEGDHGYAHLTRGRALKGLGRTDDALAALRRALLCRPDLAEAHLELGEALAEAGQIREGLTHIEDAVRLAGPDDPRPRQALEKWRAKSTNS